MYFGLNTFYTV